MLALPAITIAGGAIGRSVSLKLKDGYFVSACIFAASIGPPSDGKSPALAGLSEAIKRFDRKLEDDYERDLLMWEEEAQRQLPGGKPKKPGPPPKQSRIEVDEITMECVPQILADNPRGIIRLQDELTALLLGMNQYKSGGKGSDRPTLLKIWSGARILKDRVGYEGNKPVRCPHPFMSIAGGITPDMLGSMVDPNGRADGFLDRCLFAYPDPHPVPDWSRRGLPEPALDGWCDLVARLWDRSMASKEGRPVPNVAFMSPEGEASWIRLYNAHAAEMNAPEFPPMFRGPWGKFRDYAGRLALILACAHHASDPTRDRETVPLVGPRDIEGAWRLIEFFKSQTRRVHAAIAHSSTKKDGKASEAISKWLKDGDRLAFSLSEVKQARKWITDDMLEEALQTLVRRNLIWQRTEEGGNPKRKGGRPRSPSYDVNPEFLERFSGWCSAKPPILI